MNREQRRFTVKTLRLWRHTFSEQEWRRVWSIVEAELGGPEAIAELMEET